MLQTAFRLPWYTIRALGAPVQPQAIDNVVSELVMDTEGRPDYEGAKAYALERLARDLPSWLYYHSLWHTQDEVAPRTEWLARQEGLSREATVLLGTAAYFHDIGFTRTSVGMKRKAPGSP